MAPRLRLGTRGSRLALAQATTVSERLQELGYETEIVTIRTSGDRGERERLGAFVHEIQRAILDGNVDIGLHCLKDLPTTPVPGLSLAAHLTRDLPHDALISRGPALEELPVGSAIGTGSLRRTSQLAAVRKDLKFRPLMGNIDTRMRKLVEGDYDAIVLAITGLRRLGLVHPDRDEWLTTEYPSLTIHRLPVETMLPAPGQAVLVLETRDEDEAAMAAAATLHHNDTAVCANAERAFLATFGGGCSVPVAALATGAGTAFTLSGLVASPDGQTVLRETQDFSTGPAGVETGIEMARRTGERGAFEIVRAAGRNWGSTP